MGLGALQYVLDRGEENDWFADNTITGFAIASAAGIIAFIVWELRQENPLNDLQLLRNPNFAVASVMMFLVGFILLGSTQLIPQFVQSLLGYTATTAGMVLPRRVLDHPADAAGGAADLAHRRALHDRLRPRPFGRGPLPHDLLRHRCRLLDGGHRAHLPGRGPRLPLHPHLDRCLCRHPAEKNNNASAIINLSRNLGGSIGIALLTTFLARRSQYHRSVLVDHIAAGDHRYNSTAAHMAQHMASMLGGTPHQAMQMAQAQIEMMVNRQAAMLSYIDDFMLLAILFAGVIPFIFLMKRPPSVHRPGAGGH